MVTNTESVWLMSSFELVRQLRNSGIEVLTPAPFEPGRFDAVTLSEIKRSGIRITIAMSNDDDVQAVASIAQRQGMSEAGWAWVVSKERLSSLAMQVQLHY